MMHILVMTVVLFLTCGIPSTWAQMTTECSMARPCVLGWDANTEPDMAEYRLYLSKQSGQYGVTPVLVIPHPTTQDTTASLGPLPDGQKFMVLTAVDTSGNESLHSNEITFRFDEPPAAPRLRITVTVP